MYVLGGQEENVSGMFASVAMRNTAVYVSRDCKGH